MKKNFLLGIKTIIGLISISLLLIITSFYFIISLYSQKNIMEKEFHRYFLQTKYTSQIIFDEEINRLFSNLNVLHFNKDYIIALKSKDRKNIEEELNSQINLFDIVIVKNLENSFMAKLDYLLLSDYSPILKWAEKINSYKIDKWIMGFDSPEGKKVFIFVSKGIIDDETGDVVGIFIGGMELSNNISILNKIAKNSFLDSVDMLFENEIIRKTSENKKNIIEPSEKVIIDYKRNIISYKTHLHFEPDNKDIGIVFHMSSNYFDEFRKNLIKGSLFLLIPLLLGFIILFLAIHRLLVLPLEGLKNYASRLSKKDLNVSPPSLYIKEYNEMCNYLKNLIDNLISKEVELSNTNEKLNELFDNMKSGVAIYEAYNDGEDFVFKSINKSSMKMESIKPEDVIGKKVTEAFPGVKDMGLFDVFVKVYKTGQPMLHPIAHYRDKRIDVYRENFVLKLSTGEIVAIYDDLTIQKQAEEKLILARDEAERANRAKSEFLANMSHEIRTPMNAIIGLNEILKETNLDEDQQDIVEKILESSKLLLNILNDILDYSKIEAGRFEVLKEKVNLKKLVRKLNTIFSNSASQKGINLEFIVDDNVPNEFISDEMRLTQVIGNLISNAIKFTEKGGVTVEVKILEQIDEKNVKLICTVSDTGIGISDENIKSIFEPFIQADSSITRRYGGTGLGLAISKKIVSSMGGEIEVKSKVGEGSSFCFCLPVEVINWKSSTDEMVENHDEIKTFNDLKGINVLAIEDNPINQEVLVKILNKIGINVDTAFNGIEGVKKFQEDINKYDLILMDIQMPMMDGYTAALKIREIDKNIPIIALTAAAMVEDKIKAIESGMTDHLPKPIDKNKLLELISKYVKIAIKYEEDKKELTNNNDIIDIRQLIDILDSEETAYEILSHFKESLLNEDFKDIISIINSKKPDAQQIVHTLKGVSGNVRAKKLFEICQQIDKKYKNNEEITENDISELENRIKEVLNEIDMLIEMYNNSSQERKDFRDLDIYNRVLKLIQNSEAIDENLMGDFINSIKDKVSKVDIKLFEKYIKELNYRMAFEVMKNWQLF